jgi:excisionase family DNA binding protein
MTTPPIEVFTLKEVAAALRMSERTVREHLKRHRFPKAGGRWLFTRAEISALYEAMKCPSSSRKDPAATTGTL